MKHPPDKTPAKLLYKNQLSSELHLTLFVGSGDFVNVIPLAMAHVEHAGVHVHAAVIGASHVVQLTYNNDLSISEMVACSDGPTDPPPEVSIPISTLTKPFVFSPRADVNYRFEAERGTERDGEQRIQSLTSAIENSHGSEDPTSAIGLHYSFPKTPTGSAPRTLIHAVFQHNGEGVLIRTAHTYPDEATIIFSVSRFSIAF